MANTIADMLAMETAEPDATLTPLDVFGEKSKDADDAVEYGMGLPPEEIMDIAMSVTPMGGVKAGKGAISFLKGLLGRAKSQSKFPVGYGYPSRGVSPADRKMLDKFFEQRKLKEVLSRIDKPEQFSKIDKTLGRTPSKGTVEWMELQKALNPKGMRKVGVRVKDKVPDPEEYGGVWTEWITPKDAIKR